MGDTISESHSHIIRRSDYILFFAEDVSLTDITMTGLAFVLLYLMLYIALIFWAHLKDRQKHVYSDKVDTTQNTHTQAYTQGGSPSKSPVARRANFRSVNIDITSETLDFTTNQSVRYSDDPKDMSAIFQYTSPDSKDLNVTSPINRLDLSSPIQSNDKVIKFNHVRTPTRQASGGIDFKKAGFGSQVDSLTTVDDSAPRDQESGTKDDIPISKDDVPISKDDVPAQGYRLPTEEAAKEKEFAYPARAKQPAKKKAKEIKNVNVRPVVQVRQTTGSKFTKLLSQRHVFLSTIKRMSKISPRYKRVSLIYFLLSCDLFGMSFTFIDLSIFEANKLLPLMKVSVGSWILFMMISWLSSVSKDGLKKAKTNEQFQSELASIEKEAKYKDIAVHLIIGLFTICAVIQYGLFVSFRSSYFLSWCLCSLGVFAMQMLVYDGLWLLVVAAIYVRAYESREMRKMYRQLNMLRFWRI